MQNVQSREQVQVDVKPIMEDNEEDPLKQEEAEYICFGDIVTLSTISQIRYLDQKIQEKGEQLLIYDDGFNISDPDCIPNYSKESLSFDQVMKLCLFKIENEKPCVESLKTRKEAYEYGNQNEFERVKGQKISFGDKVVLRHCESSGFLTFRQYEIAKQHGCARVSVKKQIQEGSIMEIQHFEGGKQYMGTSVKYDIPFVLVYQAKNEQIKYYLNAHKNDTQNRQNIRIQVNAGLRPTSWQAALFKRHDYQQEDYQISSGDPLRLFHTKSKSFLNYNLQQIEVREPIEILFDEKKEAERKKNLKKIQEELKSDIIKNIKEKQDQDLNQEQLEENEIDISEDVDDQKELNNTTKEDQQNENKQNVQQKSSIQQQALNEHQEQNQSLQNNKSEQNKFDIILMFKNKSAQAIWEVQRKDAKKGGNLIYGEDIVIKHCASMKYLEVINSEEEDQQFQLNLTKDRNSEGTVFQFFLYEEKEDQNLPIDVRNSFLIYSRFAKVYLGKPKIQDNKIQIQQKQKEELIKVKFQIKLYSQKEGNRKDLQFSADSIFNSLVIYKLTLLTPHLVEFYRFLC